MKVETFFLEQSFHGNVAVYPCIQAGCKLLGDRVIGVLHQAPPARSRSLTTDRRPAYRDFLLRDFPLKHLHGYEAWGVIWYDMSIL
jgi:hypothetical protein